MNAWSTKHGHHYRAEIVHKAWCVLRVTPCSPPVPHLPKGEGYGSSLREFHVKDEWHGSHGMRLTTPFSPAMPLITRPDAVRIGTLSP